MELSPGVTYALLEKIRKNEILWNTSLENYKSRNLKRSLMDKICSELRLEYPKYADQLSTEILTKRFHYLRSNFQKLLKKAEKTPSGSGSTSAVKWEYYSACKFLQPVYTTDSNSSSFEIPEDSMTSTEQINEELVWTGDISELVDDPLTDALAKDTDIPSANCNSISEESSRTSSPQEIIPVTPRTKKRKASKLDNNMKTIMDSFSTVHTAWNNLQQSKITKPKNPAAELVAAFMEMIPEHQPELKRKFHNGLLALVHQVSQEFTEPPSKAASGTHADTVAATSSSIDIIKRSRISNSSLTETPDTPTMSDTDSFQLGNGLSMAIKDVKCVETLNEPVMEENDITIKEEHLYQEEELGTFEHFGCETCGDVFALKCDLEDHMKEVHMEGKLLSCSNCDKQFCEESELKLHAQIHVKGETFHNEMKSLTRRRVITKYLAESKEKTFDMVLQTEIKHHQAVNNHHRTMKEQRKKYLRDEYLRRWAKANRTKSSFLSQNKNWLDITLVLDTEDDSFDQGNVIT
ncbi:uncharacterized protein LOC122243750 isoform X2 [Penaeus japonicus]|uniref:uncharacterized protein LOC122243750 isoform X2 n=1 Tax=Penaeus japonicus TaxID=27405 RepID=UPI001C70E504|nr:uncharacterized protein LOC122243750 isoform X2 [Penaeus japonicus]